MTLRLAASRKLPKQRRRVLHRTRIHHNRIIIDRRADGHIICSGADIAEHEPLSDEARFHANLLDMVEQAVTAATLDGSVIYQNRSADMLYGWSVADATQRSAQTGTTEPWRARELEILARVSSGKSWTGEMLVHRWDGVAFPSLMTASPIHNDKGELIGIVSVSTDITTQKQTEFRLEKIIKRLENLREIERAILVSQSPELIAKAAITRTRDLVPYQWSSVSIFSFEAQEAQLIAIQSARATSFETGAYFPLDVFTVPNELKSGKVYAVDDLHGLALPEPMVQVLVAEGIRSYISAPLMVQDRLIGSLNLGATARGAFAAEHLEIAQEIADQLAIAIYNAQLFTEVRRYADELEQRVAERTAELSKANNLLNRQIQERQQAEAAEREQRALAEALRDVAGLLNSTLDLDEVLVRILDNIGRVVPHHAASIMFLEADKVRIVRCQGYDQYEQGETVDNLEFPIGDVLNLQWMESTGQAMVIPDTKAFPDWVAFPGADWVRSYAGAPISLEGNVIGFLNIDSATPGFFRPLHAERLQIFADQAAIAIQNARLYEQSQALAALEERQRLSHELHDAVSQTLWSASLIADILPNLWEQDVEKGREKLTRLRHLTRGALAEMRTLLLELHPTALLEVGINELLQRLCEVATSRTGIVITPVLEGEIVLPPNVQVALYRIAQEALNNIARHAAASQISVHLHGEPQLLTLRIKDNGRGFPPENARPGHMGLSIMRKRALAIGASLEIDSQVGNGTEIIVAWSPKKE